MDTILEPHQTIRRYPCGTDFHRSRSFKHGLSAPAKARSDFLNREVLEGLAVFTAVHRACGIRVNPETKFPERILLPQPRKGLQQNRPLRGPDRSPAQDFRSSHLNFGDEGMVTRPSSSVVSHSCGPDRSLNRFSKEPPRSSCATSYDRYPLWLSCALLVVDVLNLSLDHHQSRERLFRSGTLILKPEGERQEVFSKGMTNRS
jgi:hypothetical protein